LITFGTTEGWIDLWISDDGQYLYQCYGLTGEVGVYEISGAELTLIQEVGGLPQNNVQGIVSVGQINDNPIVFEETEEAPENVIDLEKLMAENRASEVVFSDLTVYPNPTSGDALTIAFTLQSDTDYTLSIFSIDGSSRASTNTNVSNRSAGFYSERVDLSQFADGVYIVQLKSGEEIMHEKFIIQR